MTPEQTLGLILTLLVMIIGCGASVVPAIPGTPIVLIAAIGHKLYFRDTSIGWIVLTLLVATTAVAMILDYLATVFGARRFGAHKKGMVGAIVGGLLGLWFSLPGILLGPLIGATTFELLGGREFKEALRAGIGATLGLFAGAVGKIICCSAMMVLFTADVLWRSLR